MFDHVRKDLLGKVKPGTPHCDDVRKAMETCFAIGDQAVQARREAQFDSTISGSERQRRLKELTEGALAIRIESAFDPFKAVQASLERAQSDRRRTGSTYVTENERATTENLHLVRAAMYLAKRDLDGR